MLAAYFGQIASGELGRTRYFVLTLVLVLASVVACVGMGIGFGLKNVLPVFLPLAGALAFARLNIAAKRWRSIGLSGWVSALASAAACTVVLWVAPPALGLATLALGLSLELLLPASRGPAAGMHEGACPSATATPGRHR